ncbi:hypothetical protein HELRODRAFT_160151 [Helobdella robusta]|uniref:Uncharacterized protein n=1 Tax=Helobdella robusta TaxID=6412 RepID=T1EPW2_HELRO|nr:hypothetical protein HELRODRAFT_160151 [Helobdella robusta]ESO06036.1 hypothetical protein HELRODRAFT_160151 [Helobdella robusta]
MSKNLHGKTALCRSLEQISTTPAATTSSPTLSQIYEEETDENRSFLHFREINFGPSKNFIYNVLSKSSVPQKLDFHLSIQLLDVPYHNSNHFNLAPFFTPSCLFIVVFDLRLYRDSHSLLRTWLSIVQDYNMKGHVILVGTFLDCLTEAININVKKLNYFNKEEKKPKYISHCAAANYFSSTSKGGYNAICKKKNFEILLGEPPKLCHLTKNDICKVLAQLDNANPCLIEV